MHMLHPWDTTESLNSAPSRVPQLKLQQKRKLELKTENWNFLSKITT